MTARDWRGFSEEQWGRLGGAVSADRGTRSQRSASLAEFRRISLGLAPVALCAAFLLAPSESGTRRPTAGGVVSEEIKMKSIEWVGLVVAGVVSSSAVGQDLLVNGGLEGAPGGTCAQNFVSPGSNAIPGWVVSGAWNVDWMRDGSATTCLYCPAEAACLVDLNGSPNSVSGSAIRQFIPTVAGKSYRLSLQAVSSFYNTDAGTIKTLRVTTGVVQSDFGLVTPAIYSDCGDCPWEEIAVQFTATASETEIELRSMHPNSAGGIHIDQIQVVELPCLGDLDASDSVTGVDLAIVLTNWNAPNPKYPEADVNGDGAVDGADLAIVLSNWGPCP